VVAAVLQINGNGLEFGRSHAPSLERLGQPAGLGQRAARDFVTELCPGGAALAMSVWLSQSGQATVFVALGGIKRRW
jgi:hypothetical protein